MQELLLEKLIIDGRIHPARIEEMVKKARKEVEKEIREAGEQAAFEVGHSQPACRTDQTSWPVEIPHKLRAECVETFTRSRPSFRGDGIAELGANVKLAKRGGLLHDIGKAVDHEVEGPHIQIGADLAKKYRESNDVIHCIQAHHGDVEADRQLKPYWFSPQMPFQRRKAGGKKRISRELH